MEKTWKWASENLSSNTSSAANFFVSSSNHLYKEGLNEDHTKWTPISLPDQKL